MSVPESTHVVWVGHTRAGLIHQRGDHTRFALDESYRADPGRPVLGMLFEQDLSATHSAALRLPPWFSNLLPEGRLRDWIADERGVSADREMELLAQVGHDLPGAVQVLPSDIEPLTATRPPPDGSAPHLEPNEQPGWRFSLAGVQLKFSMLANRDRLTMPAHGEGGDWILKLPDREYRDVPLNEFAMMRLASAAGIEVPELRLVHRDDLDGLPANVWPGDEEWAYACSRFDRSERRNPVHIEDLAQVCNVYPDRKYYGNYESVASLLYRRRDKWALEQFARRLAFMVLISNGDGHLKNWSLIYRDPKRATVSPAYDLVATAPYRINGRSETLALKFGGSRRFDQVNLSRFRRLQERLGASDIDLVDCVDDTAQRTISAWPDAEEVLKNNPQIRSDVKNSIETRAKTLRVVHAA